MLEIGILTACAILSPVSLPPCTSEWYGLQGNKKKKLLGIPQYSPILQPPLTSKG